jgi:hypothetical protein
LHIKTLQYTVQKYIINSFVVEITYKSGKIE